jgi:hypothetical protein
VSRKNDFYVKPYPRKQLIKLIINPSGRLTAASNRNKYIKVKDRLNGNSQSQIDSSDLAHISRDKISQVGDVVVLIDNPLRKVCGARKRAVCSGR